MKTKEMGMAGFVLLAMLLPHPLMCLPAAQQTGHSSTQAAASNQATSSRTLAADAGNPQQAPDAPPYPFWRMMGVLFSGLAISTARLARKFRRFWGLGVLANPYAPPFVIFGMGLCGMSATAEHALIPHVGFLGPWIADLSGIAVWLILPAIRFKPNASAAGETNVRDLAGASSSNPILAMIEDGIRDHIVERMQLEIGTAARHYSWDAIKAAARRSIEGEMTIGRLGREEADAARQIIDAFQPDADSRRDSDNKYEALQCLLRCSSFKRLHRALEMAAIES